MREDVLAIPDQIRDALWRIDSAQLSSRKSTGLVVAGMGGSAIGAELARGILGDRLIGPLAVWRDYELPHWLGPEWALLASSYSGNTEETLAAFTSAGKLGLHRWAAGTGGALVEEARSNGVEVVGLPGLFQPRAAVAYMVVVALHAAHLAGVATDVRDELESSIPFLESQRENLARRAAEMAARIGEAPMVVHGAGPTIPIARRWTNQLNENAKQFSFAVEIPEANHNLTEAWPAGRGGLGAIFLADPDQHPNDRRRIEISREMIERTGARVLSVECEGSSATERLFWCVMLGDLISLEVADLRGMDAAPVEGIENLKRRLRETR
ncbi:MAG: bifunctional phosphoglucose/phosphomannose isomerase [Solirubrobacterales bacterium]|nr:bifunctional phosphoglucose/phosphomannose isomerase [Solirubrobacterales bacterium]